LNRRVPDTVRLAERFQGFTDGALGGYAAGVVGKRIEGPVEANLRNLPPMERELELREAGGSFELRDGDTLILDARPAQFELEIPEPPDVDEAEAAGKQLIHDEGTQLYPGCFTCGPDRAEGDGLRLFMGRLPERDGILAAAWPPHRDLAGPDGALPEELVWAALDCPTIWAAWSVKRPAAVPTDGFSVLARQRLEMVAPVPVGETAVVSAWPIERDGRKHLTAAAIHGKDGDLLARAESLLVDVPRPPR
jgi:hypothetical protein